MYIALKDNALLVFDLEEEAPPRYSICRARIQPSDSPLNSKAMAFCASSNCMRAYGNASISGAYARVRGNFFRFREHFRRPGGF